MNPDDRYGSDRSLLEKLGATVEETSQETRNGRPACYYVSYEDGSYEMEPGTVQNHAVFSADIDEDVIGDGIITLTGKVLLRDGDVLVENKIHIDHAVERVRDQGKSVSTIAYVKLKDEYGTYIPKDMVSKLEIGEYHGRLISWTELEGYESGMTEDELDALHMAGRAEEEAVAEDYSDTSIGFDPARDDEKPLSRPREWKDDDDPWSEDEINDWMEDVQAGDDATDEMTKDGRPIDVSLEIDLNTGTHTIGVDYETAQSERFELTASESRSIMDLLLDALKTGITALSVDEANLLYDTFRTAKAERVRTDVIEEFLDKYDPRMVEPSSNGWIVADTFVVTYDGQNYLVDEPDTHKLSNSGIVEYDDDHPFIKFDVPLIEEKVYTLNGEEVYVSAKEQRFLITVELLTNPDQHLGVDNFEGQVLSAYRAAVGAECPELEQQTAEAEIEAFIDPITGFIHRHDLNKHTLTSTFGLTRRVVNDLYYNSYDHAGVHELLYREDELRDADFSVFYEHENDDDEVWKDIKRISNSAKVHNRIHDELASMYGPK